MTTYRYFFDRLVASRFLRRLWMVLALACAGPTYAERITLSLDGNWEIEDSASADAPPTRYAHVVPVPGLVHSATPAFENVDKYQSRELLVNLVGKGLYNRSDYEKLGDADGISRQKRNYFWYHRLFRLSAHRTYALLKIGKAQFGAAVYLNGRKIGEHLPCFTAAYFDISKALRWNGTNELTIRVGAHPGVLPSSVSAGTDFEKNRWTPGIYDDVSVMAFDGPGITSVQAAPKIESSQVIVQTELHNFGAKPMTTTLQQTVSESKTGQVVGFAKKVRVTLGPGQVRLVQQTVAISKPHLWSPESPFLYRIKTRTTSDSSNTRFAMREFHFDTVTQRAYLNGHPYFLRGSNIALHRFFEDPESGTLPWNESWLQRLLVDVPRSLHWNSFRFTIGPVPDRWLQIADEAGLLIQNEYMVWVGHPEPTGPYQHRYDVDEMKLEFTEWMRDNWNHPSVVIWNASNESWVPDFTYKIIPQVRTLDLSNRPWGNGYSPPSGSNDPMDDHPYLFVDTASSGRWQFRMTDLEGMQGLAVNSTTSQTGHALLLNEYGWLWLNRDGSPTLLTNKLYPLLLESDSTAEQRFATQAYLLAGETEYWRAHRRYAGVLHFVYLTASAPDAFTADHFVDLQALTLEPHFLDYMKQAFKPLGVYINFWHEDLRPDADKLLTVLMVNDDPQMRNGTLRLDFVDEHGGSTPAVVLPFHLEALGADSFEVNVRTPARLGRYTLTATATTTGADFEPTFSRRWVVIKPVVDTADASSSK